MELKLWEVTNSALAAVGRRDEIEVLPRGARAVVPWPEVYPPSKLLCFKFCQVIFRSYLNTTVKFFEGEGRLSKSRSLFSGWHYIWWPNVCECWTGSSQIESLSTKFTEAFMYFLQPSLRNFELRDAFLDSWIYKHWFLRFRTWQMWCKTLQNLIRKPCQIWCDSQWHLFQSPGILGTLPLWTLLAPSVLHLKMRKKYILLADSIFYRQFNFLDGGMPGSPGNRQWVKKFQTPGHS
jgi:hypothetical protein